jgi:hypothetical protein
VPHSWGEGTRGVDLKSRPVSAGSIANPDPASILIFG